VREEANVRIGGKARDIESTFVRKLFMHARARMVAHLCMLMYVVHVPHCHLSQRELWMHSSFVDGPISACPDIRLYAARSRAPGSVRERAHERVFSCAAAHT
jgi:hypothetical protein